MKRRGLHLDGGERAVIFAEHRWGTSQREIGRLLGISPLTVKNHVQRILVKLKVNNRTQAANEGSAAKPPADETAD